MIAKLEGDFVRENRLEVKRRHKQETRRDAILLAFVVFGLWIALLALTN